MRLNNWIGAYLLVLGAAGWGGCQASASRDCNSPGVVCAAGARCDEGSGRCVCREDAAGSSCTCRSHQDCASAVCQLSDKVIDGWRQGRCVPSDQVIYVDRNPSAALGCGAAASGSRMCPHATLEAALAQVAASPSQRTIRVMGSWLPYDAPANLQDLALGVAGTQGPISIIGPMVHEQPTALSKGTWRVEPPMGEAALDLSIEGLEFTGAGPVIVCDVGSCKMGNAACPRITLRRSRFHDLASAVSGMASVLHSQQQCVIALDGNLFYRNTGTVLNIAAVQSFSLTNNVFAENMGTPLLRLRSNGVGAFQFNSLLGNTGTVDCTADGLQLAASIVSTAATSSPLGSTCMPTEGTSLSLAGVPDLRLQLGSPSDGAALAIAPYVVLADSPARIVAATPTQPQLQWDYTGTAWSPQPGPRRTLGAIEYRPAMDSTAP